VGRAARYAALADPVRLRIIDLLTLGDVAPVELQAELGISSSLLAHHLNLLEREGMLVRTRSEADRRRTYLHLAPGAFEGLVPSPAVCLHRQLGPLAACCRALARRQRDSGGLGGHAPG